MQCRFLYAFGVNKRGFVVIQSLITEWNQMVVIELSKGGYWNSIWWMLFSSSV